MNQQEAFLEGLIERVDGLSHRLAVVESKVGLPKTPAAPLAPSRSSENRQPTHWIGPLYGLLAKHADWIDQQLEALATDEDLDAEDRAEITAERNSLTLALTDFRRHAVKLDVETTQP